ncbi:MAG TPA: S53 family peptidase, partial [Terriglobales bacterium]
MGTRVPRMICIFVLGLMSAASVVAQQLAPQPLITQPVDESQLSTLRGNTHPLAQPQFDIGAAPPDLPMQRMLLVLKRAPQQDFALHKLLDGQQDKASPSYHKWLTPDQFGTQFGASEQDMQLITGWLQANGFQVNRVSHGRTVIEFSGVEAQVEQAFHTQIHQYLVNGEQHWANASDPQIPAALVPAVAGVLSLHNFPRKSMVQIYGKYSSRSKQLIPARPEFTFLGGCDLDNNCYAVAPADFGTIYNAQPLWNSGIDGTGQTIAIVGESDINIQDVRDFRSTFGLPPKDPKIIYDGPNPGMQPDEGEADIDVQWSGAIAPNATIDFVASQSTETTAGVDLSAIYIIDNDLAPVMSESYGECELGLGTSGNQFYNSLWAQAAAQGITVILSSGDSGSSSCDQGSPQPAQFGLSVSGFASTPFNVAVGGTDFNDITNPQQYWNVSNTSATQESAKGYIPETTWNSTCTNSVVLGLLGWGTNAENNCNNSQLIFQAPFLLLTDGGSGGVSNCTSSSSQNLSSCSGGYIKPPWQVAPGVPADFKRDLPDVSLFASNGFSGNFYIFCESDAFGTCNTFNFGAAGGTSFGAPAFAGIMALVNQQMQMPQGQGNA